MKNSIIIVVFALLISNIASAQTLADAYLISNQRVNGTARASGMGNAFGALGGDITSLSINPAGIGMYRTGEFVFTPVIKSNSSELTLNGNSFTDSKFQIKINNIGLTGVVKINDGTSGITSFNYGFGYNNILDFNRNFYGSNNNSSTSFLDGIVNWANAENLSNNYLNQNINKIEYRDWPTKLAWDTYLIDPQLDNNNNEIDGKYKPILYQDEKVNQNKSYTQTGGIDEFTLTGGLNINHQLYFGATFGIQNVDLSQRTEYSETFNNNGAGNTNSYVFGENTSLKGTGYNLKFGAIYKPVNNIRLGASIHTPTYYVLNETKSLWINSMLNENYSLEGINLYDYNFFSPWKAIISGAYIFGKTGLISVDAEYLDYSTMRYRRSTSSNEDLSSVNTDITNGFNKSLNVRIGGELKITPQFSLRGGYEYYPNSQKKPNPTIYQPVSIDNSSVYALGFGYATNGFFADMTYRRTTDKYLLNEVQPNFDSMNLTNSNNKILLTFGFKF